MARYGTTDDARSLKNQLPATSGNHGKRIPFGSLESSVDSSLRKKLSSFAGPSTNSAYLGFTGIPFQNYYLLNKLLPDVPLQTYSCKVFIGGLPQNIDQDDIRLEFLKYGSLAIDWPHKLQSKARVPPKGYAFLLFQEEASVHKLVTSCLSEGDKLFTYIKYGPFGLKKSQVIPWKIGDGLYMSDPSIKVDPHQAVFVGGVPRSIKACQLAEVMANKFGAVTLVAIDCKADLNYPKGAACVVFATKLSFVAAVSSKFVQLEFGLLQKKVELKPYIKDDHQCDECNGVESDGRPAPFFCGSVICLKYYCEYCWATFHSFPGRQNHCPVFKVIDKKILRPITYTFP